MRAPASSSRVYLMKSFLSTRMRMVAQEARQQQHRHAAVDDAEPVNLRAQAAGMARIIIIIRPANLQVDARSMQEATTTKTSMSMKHSVARCRNLHPSCIISDRRQMPHLCSPLSKPSESVYTIHAIMNRRTSERGMDPKQAIQLLRTSRCCGRKE